MSAWQASRPGDKILQLDLPLSYGIFDHFQDPDALNAVQFLWDPTKDVGVYIKVNFFPPINNNLLCRFYILIYIQYLRTDAFILGKLY